MRRSPLPLLLVLVAAATACSSSTEQDSAPSSPDPIVESSGPTGSDFTGADGSLETAETPDAGSADTVESDTGPAETVADDSSSGSVDPPDDDTPDDSTTGDDLEDDLQIPLDQVDDTPVCQSFAKFFNGFSQVALAGAFVQLGNEGGAGADPATTVEMFEVVRYLDLVEVIPELRSELPDAILDAFNPIFDRAEAAPGLMADAGFSQDELDQLVSDLNADQLDELEQDPRTIAAADALIAEYGTFESVLANLESLGSLGEDEGDAWIADTCPELSTLFNS
jgi:hypothetical protein